jgi:hypothetical protein
MIDFGPKGQTFTQPWRGTRNAGRPRGNETNNKFSVGPTGQPFSFKTEKGAEHYGSIKSTSHKAKRIGYITKVRRTWHVLGVLIPAYE